MPFRQLNRLELQSATCSYYKFKPYFPGYLNVSATNEHIQAGSVSSASASASKDTRGFCFIEALGMSGMEYDEPTGKAITCWCRL